MYYADVSHSNPYVGDFTPVFRIASEKRNHKIFLAVRLSLQHMTEQSPVPIN